MSAPASGFPGRGRRPLPMPVDSAKNGTSTKTLPSSGHSGVERSCSCAARRAQSRFVPRAADQSESERAKDVPVLHRSIDKLSLLPLKLLRFTAVRERTGLSRSTVWRLERRGAFPKHVKVSANIVAWLEEDVSSWIRIEDRIGPSWRRMQYWTSQIFVLTVSSVEAINSSASDGNSLAKFIGFRNPAEHVIGAAVDAMKVRHVEIGFFRGIEHLSWTLGGDVVCLIGPGDSTKTTVLEAIELALSPRWNVPFDDTDFYMGKTDQPVEVAVTVGELSDKLKSEAKYGYLARGWSPNGTLHDEPADDDELVLTIRLRVDSSLEPTWVVTNDRNPDGKSISAADREKLGCARLGEYLDRQFSWGRGSLLTKLTGEAESLSAILADAGRAARNALATLDKTKLPNLYAAVAKAKKAGADFGVPEKSLYRPHLDVQAVSVGAGGLSLHDGEVPLRRAGLGTRRLLAVAVQWELARTGGVTLIDEVEHGLEPHRVRRLLAALRGINTEKRQVIMTTHAPVALQEMSAAELRVVRSVNGTTQILRVEEKLQPIVKRVSEAFLARKVLVCEGKTEMGVCRRLDQLWATTGQSFGFLGLALADGGGSQAAPTAKAFADLGYDVALFGDSDQSLEPDRATLESAGAKVIQWRDGMALEQRIALDLPWDGVVAMVALAMEVWGAERVRDAVAARLSVKPGSLGNAPAEWTLAGHTESGLREAVGATAKSHKVGGISGWFKRVDLAYRLATIVLPYLAIVAATDLAKKLEELRIWAQADE
jgi:putative ATP-dependent endonuclease of the OLD family